MSPSNFRYVTRDGGPPNGGRAPGMALSPQESAAAPPPYSVSYQMPAMMHMCVPQPTFTVFRAPAPSPPPPPPPQINFVCSPPPQVNFVWSPPAAPPVAPPPTQLLLTASSAKPDIPGETLRGSQVKFEDGTGFLFPETTTQIHFITNGIQPWARAGQTHSFVIDHVDVSWTVRTLIKRLGIEAKGARTRGIAECFENGNGIWTKGTAYMPIDEEFEKGRIRSTFGANVDDGFLEGQLNALRKHDGCDVTLESLGWDKSRGTTQKPVWLALCEA